MSATKRRYLKTKFMEFLAENNRIQNEDEIQKEETDNTEDKVQDEDLITEIMNDRGSKNKSEERTDQNGKTVKLDIIWK
jgi:hypothetical protein